MPTDDRGGTAGYRAPEILENPSVFNNKVDIWAMGCVLFELVTGKAAFTGDMAVLNQYQLNVELKIHWDDTFDKATRDAFQECIHLMVRNQFSSRPSASTLHQKFQIHHCAAIHLENQRLMTDTMAIGLFPAHSHSHDNEYYSNALEHLATNISSWATAQFQPVVNAAIAPHQIEQIRTGFQKLQNWNPSLSDSTVWKKHRLDLLLRHRKFRVTFARSTIGLFLHEKVFSGMTHVVENHDLNYWLQRYCDEVSMLGMLLLCLG